MKSSDKTRTQLTFVTENTLEYVLVNPFSMCKGYLDTKGIIQ
jgi:hypothetical protein